MNTGENLHKYKETKKGVKINYKNSITKKKYITVKYHTPQMVSTYNTYSIVHIIHICCTFLLSQHLLDNGHAIGPVYNITQT